MNLLRKYVFKSKIRKLCEYIYSSIDTKLYDDKCGLISKDLKNKQVTINIEDEIVKLNLNNDDSKLIDYSIIMEDCPNYSDSRSKHIKESYNMRIKQDNSYRVANIISTVLAVLEAKHKLHVAKSIEIKQRQLMESLPRSSFNDNVLFHLMINLGRCL